MLSAIRRPAALGVVRAATAALLVVGVVAHLGWVLGFVLDTELSPWRSTTSELSAGGQPHRDTFRALEVVSGIAFLLSGPPLLRIGPVQWQVRVAIGILVVFASLLILHAVLPLDCAVSIEAACQARAEFSTAHQLHRFVSVLLSFLYVVGAASLALWWHGGWRAVAVATLLVQTVAAVSLAVMSLRGPGHLVGLADRVQLVGFTAVMVAGVVYLAVVQRGRRRRDADAQG